MQEDTRPTPIAKRRQPGFPGFGLRLTRWGGTFLVAMFVTGVAAVNTGNNALVMLLGLAMGSYVVSGLWSRQVLKSLEVRFKPPRELFAGAVAPVELEITNTSRVFPALGIVLRDQSGEALTWIPSLAARASARRVVEVELPTRGWHELGPFRLEVLLPLGFFLKSKRAGESAAVLVYPRLLPGGRARAAEDRRRRSPEVGGGRGREGDVTQLRPFRQGDDPRQIHWKQSARQQRLIAMDREGRSSEPAMLVLDPRSEHPHDPAVRERFERLVSEVATELIARLRRSEMVGLVIGSSVLSPIRERSQAAPLLRALAEVELQPADAVVASIARARTAARWRVREAS